MSKLKMKFAISAQILVFIQFLLILNVTARCKLPTLRRSQNIEFICSPPQRCQTNANSTFRVDTKLQVKCKENYEAILNRNQAVLVTLTCNATGSWDRKSRLNELHCQIKCGEPTVQTTPLIVNDKSTEIVRYPWHVAIYMNNSYICGGSIINPYGDELLVLTAFHCFALVGGNKEDFRIVVGAVSSSWSQNIQAESTQILRVKQFIGHDRYDPTRYTEDIVLVQTETPIRVTSNSLPVCLPSDPLVTDGPFNSKTVVIGFGQTGTGQPVSEKLRRVVIPVLSTQSCIAALDDEDLTISATQICAGTKDGPNTCNGDSGGGLLSLEQHPMRYTIQGIVSSAPRKYGCGRISLFTRVYSFLDWIYDTTQTIIGGETRGDDEAELDEDTTSVTPFTSLTPSPTPKPLPTQSLPPNITPGLPTTTTHPVREDCWETDTCQLISWSVLGCAQYGRVEKSRRVCPGGNLYTCCKPSTQLKTEEPCWETDTCQLTTWYIQGCAQYGRIEKSRRECPGGYLYTCCKS